MREIGGYLQFEKLINKPYYTNMIELNLGRNALIYLIRGRKIKKVFIPYFLCDSVYKVLISNEIEYEFYHVGRDFKPVFNKTLKYNHYLYIVNYYGQLDNEYLGIIKQHYNNIIIDNTQAFFQKPLDGVDTIYSLRKFFGIPDGAYLSTDISLESELAVDSSRFRIKHLFGRFEDKAFTYYKDFQRIDDSFENLPLMKMSKLTRNLLGAINYSSIIQKRNENYDYLFQKLQARNILSIAQNNAPFAYPFYVNNGIKVREKLALKKIYIPTLWPNVIGTDSKYSLESDLAANIIPLPCDQTYDLDDMTRLFSEIQDFF